MNALSRLIVLMLLILAFLFILLSIFPKKEEREERSATKIQSKEPIIVVAAGDIACGPDSKDADCKEWETSELIRKINPTAVLLLGDIQYEASQIEYFKGNDPFCQTKPPHCFGPTWGRFKNKTFPAAGNHEYSMMGASGYFDYFNGVGNFSGSAADRDKGYYSFNIGSWHLIALNSNCFAVGGCDMHSKQVRWLRNDLDKLSNKCTLAFWHNPRFSNGKDHPSDPAYNDFWKVLYEASTEIVLNGHSHYYERFMPIDPYEYVDKDKGIRQFIVGTGGKNLTNTSLPNDEHRNNETFGVLKLVLYEDRYDWEFVPIEGQTFTDSGTGYCH